MKKRAISIILILVLISINLCGCTNENNNNIKPNEKDPENVYVDVNFDENTPGWNVDYFDSIENAINNVSEDGTVFIYNGTYYENIIINKTIELIGEDREKTIINGNEKGNVLSIFDNDCTIQNINFSNAGVNSGIKILSNDNKIVNNTFFDNYYGIWIDTKTKNTVSDNIFLKNYNAIRLRSVTDTEITNNQILSNTMEGFNLETCLRITIKDNTFYEGGISISGQLIAWESHIIEDNTFNNNPIYYYKNENGITVPTDAKQVILVNCSNIDIKDSNFEKVASGIQISFGNDITVENNNFESNNINSIYMYHCENNTIKNNNINSGKGIDLLDSKYIIISKNTIKNTETAINFETSNNNQIIDNSISNNEDGIYTKYSNENTIDGNNINSNTDYGIYLQSNSNDNLIINNRFSRNDVAVRIKSSKLNNMFTNEIKESTDKGIYICCGAGDNTVYKNSFIDNKLHVDYTILTVNHFHKDSYGNYWDDYTEKYPDANQINGIWDTPYDIPGTNAIDEYPLVNPITIS
jgi:parallel beta-helix repeat protein